MNISTLRTDASLPRFDSIEALCAALKPTESVYVLRPEKFRAAARRFLDAFPGDTLYAVKANPIPYILDQVYAAGIRHFDTASLSEIELVRARIPDAQCHFMHPVRAPGAAAVAYHKYGLKDFVVDCDAELDKLMAETGGAKDLRIFVRLSTPLGGALLELSSKFGTTPDDGARLLKRVVAIGATPALTFHVGSQCLSAFSYAQAIEIARRTCQRAEFDVTVLDIGGGFPAPYAKTELPPYRWFFDTIVEALQIIPNHETLQVMCEPGRALVAEGVSLVTQVFLRKGDKLYINDGIYGSFDELTLPGFDEDYPVRALTIGTDGRATERTAPVRPYRIYGPTCDTLDVLPRPAMLPDTITAGDFLIFDSMGAYTVAARSSFNGFYPDSWAIVETV